MTAERRLFALDENFPQPIVDANASYIRHADLVPLRRIDARLLNTPDWQILLALHQDKKRKWDGLITTDARMLTLTKELSVLCQTKLTVVAVEAAGHDPIKATGLLLAYLPGICKLTKPDQAQVWMLRAVQRKADLPWEYLRKEATRHNRTPDDVFKEMKLSDAELAVAVLPALATI